MVDFTFLDPRLLFPNITEAAASAYELIANIIFLFGAVITVIAEWKMFKKFGEKPWKSLIPLYSTYLVYKYTWKKRAFGIYAVSNVIFSAAIIASEYLAQNNPATDWMTVIILIGLPFGIIATVCSILFVLRIAEAFGKKKVFCIGLLLLYSIFISILGFGKAKYVRNGENKQVEPAKESIESQTEVL